MNTDSEANSTRQAALYGLAVVGFGALIAAGMWLAIYSARYVPLAADRLGAAAVSLGSFFHGHPSSGLSVIPDGTTTIPFGFGDGATTTAPTTTPEKPVTPAQPSAGQETSTVIGANGGTPALFGLPDLIVTIDAVGYLATSSTDSFIAADTVPHGMTPAVKFTVKNVGTNVAGTWRFSASLPTTSQPIYQSIPQQTLNPGDYIDFTLGFTQPSPGSSKTISVTTDFDHAVTESNENNNSAAASLTILGS